MKKYQITIRPDGTVKVEALDCAGDSCTELTLGVEKRLGSAVGERQLKPEYHQTEEEVARTRVQEGGA
jgi:hypothetical protein